ncbi:MAG: outer membrane beta-barrel protein, partial [Geminicoccaceae bacterium]
MSRPKTHGSGGVSRLRLAATSAVAALALNFAPVAHAQTPTPSGSSVGAPAPSGGAGATGGTSGLSPWFSDIAFSAQFQGGIMFNPRPGPGERNFGQLTTDHANQFQLNQLLLTAQKAIDPKETDYAFGFKFQLLYGSDVRIFQYLGQFNHVTSDRYQLQILEANVSLHLPWLTEGGIDAKVGQYASPLGVETIDPSTTPFYSHSYIFQFGVPFVHTGVLTQTHVTPELGLYFGIDSGVNTWLGSGDNNGRAAGIAGFNLSLLDGKVTVVALTHIGPENPSRTVPNANSAQRYLNDVAVTYKATDKLTLTTEGNYIRDDAFHADGWGIAQYASYTLTETLTLNGRAEIWRDNKGFFVAEFPGNRDFVNFQRGFPATVISARPTTYSEFTVGLTYKPGLPAPVSNLMIRPEV